MNTRVEAPAIGGSFAGPILIAIIVALVVGALMGTVVTTAVNDRLAASSGVAPARPLVATPVSTPPWDAQKLEAMVGRALAEQLRGEQAVSWDAGKLEAMEARQLAEDVPRPRPVGGPLG